MPSSLDLPVPACGCREAQRAAGAPARAPLAPGLAASRPLVVDRERTIDFMGEDARVYATPMLVRDIEVACRELLLAHVEPGQDSVGTRVEIDHLAATLMGMAVTLDVRVTAVNGRAVTFEVEGRDAVDTICRGRHLRFVVDVAGTQARLAAKAAKARAAAQPQAATGAAASTAASAASAATRAPAA
jgi:predicted thioesterase